MTIWILALVLFGCLAFAGFSFGAIRAGFTFIGLMAGVFLASLLGGLLKPILGVFGMKNPFLLWITGPFIVFLLVLIVFKIVGMTVHQKVDVYYKYKAGDLRMGLWNRINARLGVAVGLLNGAVYLILISMVIYVFSYATNQMVSSGEGSIMVNTLNLLGRHVHSSGMAKVAAGIDPMPKAYYKAIDIVGLIYHNDLLEGRLSRYPAFLSLGEKPEFQAIADDKDFTEMRMKQPAFAEILNHPKAQAILNNPGLLLEIWNTAVPNLDDIEKFLRTGLSEKYDNQSIFGRWTFSPAGAVSELRKTKPNLSSADMQRMRRVLTAAFAKTTLVATTDKQVFIKNYGILKPASKPNLPPTVELQNLQGQWSEDGSKFKIDIGGKPALEAVVEGDKLTVNGDTVPWRFNRDL